jgi:uncharacterized protein
MRAVFLLAFLVVGACQRAEQPGAGPSSAGSMNGAQDAAPEAAATADAAPASDAASSDASSTPTASPTCVVPLAAEPLPQASPASQCPADPATSPPELGKGYVTFLEAPGTPRVEVEIADSAAERERGLMYRTSMPEQQGMLFSWSDEQKRTFWMRNTCLPLDMLFITKDGFIAGIVEQVPVLNDGPRSVPCPVAHVLELNAGYSRAHDLKPGTRVSFE